MLRNTHILTHTHKHTLISAYALVFVYFMIKFLRIYICIYSYKTVM